MSLARVVCRHRRLLMQFDPHSTSSTTPSLAQRLLPQKRSFSQAQSSISCHQLLSDNSSAPKSKQPRLDLPSTSAPDFHSRRLHTAVQRVSRSKNTDSTPRQTFAPEFVMPTSRNAPSSSRGRPQSSAPSHQSRNASAKQVTPKTVPGGRLQEPLRDLAYIQSTFNPHQNVQLKPQWIDNPKAPLTNYVQLKNSRLPVFNVTLGSIGGRKFNRCTVVADEELNLVGEGDGLTRKDAEQLASLSAIYQLSAQGLLAVGKKTAKDMRSAAASPAFLQTTVTPPSEASAKDNISLSDGTNVTYESARSFMDYYCRRFGFGKPDITFESVKKRKGNGSWEAIMMVGGRRIGLGSGMSKKGAQVTCYLDVVQYLDSCDGALWKDYVEAAKTGKDIGLAPKVYFNMSDTLDDEIRDLCADIKKSTLYKNRPSIGSGMTGSDPVKEASASATTSQQPIRPQARHSPQFFAAKSEQLFNRRKAYLEDPKHAAMRTQRGSLPVTAQSADILAQIAQNDVTICMAATGSGKTTQIPQLLLDEAIDRGDGARCNIVCTQPRRIAAISVAERVARERGETAGMRGSIGYQVRFDAKLPDEHGSVTFCTTGIFLKRMQSALLGGISGSRNLDDVTHVVVDEVHERDVDTDLLLVVLKRLLAERKAQNKPIKIILMSATIDPTLFQHYFKDERGIPAPVTEVPGRSFPVTKHFLDETIPTLSSPQRGASWVFQEDSVVKYLSRELGSAHGARSFSAYGQTASVQNDHHNRDGVDELEIPYPLVALTIAHVLNISDSGHVLVFLPGWDEIQAVQRILLDRGRYPLLNMDFSDSRKFAIHLLHSTIPVQEQQAVFEPPPEGVRRIILATNIAETSITIPDVVYVVDTAKIKELRYDPERHMSSLVSAWVGSSNLNQRAGRAGRHRSGEYFGILGQKRAEELQPYQTVEMKRVDLSNVVMHVKALDFPGMEVEEVLAATIEPPAPERVAAAMNDLIMVGALDDKKNLTSLGRVLLQLPVEVQMGRLVLFGSFFRCLDSALTLAAILTNRDPFLSPPMLKKESAAVKNSWTPQDFRSDALAVLFAYKAWWDLQSRGDYQAANRFCSDNFLAKPTLLMIQKIKGHLLQAMYHAGVIDVSAGGTLGNILPSRDHVPPQLNTSGDSLPLLAALIAIASQPKFAVRATERSYRTARDKATFIHPSSVNHRKWEMPDSESASPGEKQIYAFTEKRQNVSTGSSSPQMFLLGSTRLDPLSYMLFGAHRIQVTERGLECDEWLPIIGNIDALDDIQRLKTLMESCMLRVFEGVSRGQRRRAARGRMPVVQARDNAEESDDDEDDGPQARDYTLSDAEVKELDFLTRDIVRILDKYSEERIGTQSRRASRAATPQASPALRPSGLPSLGVPGRGSRSGYSTPHNVGSAYSSRAPSRSGTPSLLSEALHRSRYQ